MVFEPRSSLTMSRLTRCFVIGFVLLLATHVSLAGKTTHDSYFDMTLSI